MPFLSEGCDANLDEHHLPIDIDTGPGPSSMGAYHGIWELHRVFPLPVGTTAASEQMM